MKMFALRFTGDKNKGKLCGVTTASTHPGENCNDVEFSLESGSDNVWVVYKREIAEKAAVTNENWYNAGYATPRNNYVGKLEVVELRVVGTFVQMQK